MSFVAAADGASIFYKGWGFKDGGDTADDLAVVREVLDLRNAIMVGHSTGGGEVARYIGSHGGVRVAKVALLPKQIARRVRIYE